MGFGKAQLFQTASSSDPYIIPPSTVTPRTLGANHPCVQFARSGDNSMSSLLTIYTALYTEIQPYILNLEKELQSDIKISPTVQSELSAFQESLESPVNSINSISNNITAIKLLISQLEGNIQAGIIIVPIQIPQRLTNLLNSF
jgi:hypothetical protein